MAKTKYKKKPKRRIVDADIDFLSLCKAGANGFKTIYKSQNMDDEQSVTLTSISKMTEKGELYSVVYAPETVDSQGDIASKEVIKNLAYSFAKSNKGIDIEHNGEVLPPEDIFVAESFIIQKNDPRFDNMQDYEGNEVDVEGGWGVVLKIENEELKKNFREGVWQGISMGGRAITSVEKTTEKDTENSSLAQFIENLAKHFNLKDKFNSEKIMPLTKEDKQEIAELVKSGVAEALKVEKTEKTVEKVEKTDEKVEKTDEKKLGLGWDAPVLKDNPTEEDIAKHTKKLAMYDLSKTVDTTSSKAIFEFQRKCQEIAKSEDIEKTVKELKSDPYATFFTSNQTAGDVKKSVSGEENPLIAEINKSLDEAEKAAK